MYVFYDSDGKIPYCVGAISPEVKLTSIPEGTTPLYLDDEEYPDVKEKYSYYTIENNIPAYFTYVPDSVRLPSMQQAKIEEINLACNLEILNGFKSSASGEEHSYKFDEEYQRNFGLMIGAISVDPSLDSIPWPTKNIGIVNHTRSEFIQLYLDGKLFMESKLYRYFSLKEQILAMTSIEQIKAIVW